MTRAAPRTPLPGALLVLLMLFPGAAGVAAQPDLDFGLDDSLAPAGIDFPGQNRTWIQDGVAYFGCYAGTTPLALYTVRLSEVSKGLLTIRELVSGAVPLKDFGLLYLSRRNGKSILWDPRSFAEHSGVKVRFSQGLSSQGVLNLNYTDDFFGAKSMKRFRLKISGLTLMLIVEQTDANRARYNNYVDLYFFPMEGLSAPRPVTIPYMEEVAITRAGPPGKEFFVSTYFDITLSGANAATYQIGPNLPAYGKFEYLFRPAYDISGGGKRPRIGERFYITVANPGVPDPIEACFMVKRTRPSRFRDEVAESVYFDLWMGTPGSFKLAREFLDDLRDIGLVKLWISFQRWQYGGYGSLETRFTPARALFGGPLELKKTVARARQLGYRFGVRTAYAQLSPSAQNPYWNLNDVAYDKYGKIKYTVYGPEPQLSSLPSVRKKHYQREAGRIATDYGPNAAFFDINPSQPYSEAIDHRDLPVPMSFRDVHRSTVEMNRYHQDLYRGPLAGEGATAGHPRWVHRNPLYQAGSLDLSTIDPVGGRKAPLVPDYVARYVKPVLEYTRGYRGRWVEKYGQDPPHQWTLRDEYRAEAISVNACGYLEGVTKFPKTKNQWLLFMMDEYQLFIHLQREYWRGRLEKVLYHAGGQAMNLTEAIKRGYDFTTARLEMRYANGLQLFVNNSPRVWNALINGARFPLSGYGWYADNRRTGFVELSTDLSGGRVDFVRTPDSLYFNCRDGRMRYLGAFHGAVLSYDKRFFVAREGSRVRVVYEDANHELQVATGAWPRP